MKSWYGQATQFQWRGKKCFPKSSELFQDVDEAADKQDPRETGSFELQKVTDKVWFSRLSEGLGLAAWEDSFSVWGVFFPIVAATIIHKEKLMGMNWKIWNTETIRNIQTDSHF